MSRHRLSPHLIFESIAKSCGFSLQSEFSPKWNNRKFRWDYLIWSHVSDLYYHFVVEIHGGVFAKKKMAHSTGTGVRRDCTKINLATLYGYRTLVFTTDQIVRHPDYVESVLRFASTGDEIEINWPKKTRKRRGTKANS